jgi:hypothetical protein
MPSLRAIFRAVEDREKQYAEAPVQVENTQELLANRRDQKPTQVTIEKSEGGCPRCHGAMPCSAIVERSVSECPIH